MRLFDCIFVGLTLISQIMEIFSPVVYPQILARKLAEDLAESALSET